MVSCRLRRMLEMLAVLRSGRNNLVQDLAGFQGMSRRTVFRDLQYLKQAGVKCSYNPETSSYCVDEDVCLPSVNLNDMEAVAILLLAYKAAAYMELPFRQSCAQAAAKLENEMPARVRKFCRGYLQNISFGVQPRPKSDYSEKVFYQLLEAIQEKRVASVCYYPPSGRESIMINLNPYHLFYDEPTWYVIGNSSFHRNIQKFNLRHIKRLEVLDRSFSEKCDIGKYVGKVWSMLPRDAVCSIKLRFLPEVAKDTAETLWHSTQQVSFQSDGSALVEFRVDEFREITWWILSYGDKVQVIEPEFLRQQIVKIAQRIIKLHK